MIKKWSVYIVILLSLFLIACSDTGKDENADVRSSDDDVIKLSYAFFTPADTFPAIQMEEWKNKLEERTDGKVVVELFVGGSLLEAENMYDGVENGTADIGLSATSYEPGRFPLLTISDLYADYDNAEMASKVTSELIEKYPPEAFENFKIITSFTTEPMNIQSRDPITSLEGLKDKQLRIGGGLTSIMEELGAAPVGMSQAEVPEALQTGIVDGYVSSREILMDSNLAEMVDYITDYPIVINTFVAVMNQETWDSLPKDVQEVIDELNGEMTEFTGNYLDEHVQESLAWSEEEHGVETVELDNGEIEKWDNLTDGFLKEYIEELDEKGLPGTEYLDDLKEIVEKYSNE